MLFSPGLKWLTCNGAALTVPNPASSKVAARLILDEAFNVALTVLRIA
jgi:hypothetical protein